MSLNENYIKEVEKVISKLNFQCFKNNTIKKFRLLSSVLIFFCKKV